jgi:hypothetical protein
MDIEALLSADVIYNAHYTAAIRDWAPRPLPSERRV